MRLADKVKTLKPSPTLQMAARAKSLAAQGRDIISLAVGEPDWDTFEPIKRAAIVALQEGVTKYSPASGIVELRQGIAEWESSSLGVKYKPAEVTVSTGAKFILFSAMQVLLNPGDEVLIPAPYWVSYPTMVELAGAKPIIVGQSSDFQLNLGELESQITSRTRLLILNSPANPTGVVYSREVLRALGDLLDRHPQVNVLSDDIYNRLIFSGEEIAPHLLQERPDLRDRVIVVNGASKSFSMTGWRVGWALGPQPVIEAMSNYQSQSVSCAASFSQVATVIGLRDCQSDLAASLKVLKARRNRLFARLSEIENLTLNSPDGAFYMWPNVSAFFGGSYQGVKITGSKDLAEQLLEFEGVAVVPGVEFGCEGYLRLSYVINDDRMNEAVNRVQRFFGKISDYKRSES